MALTPKEAARQIIDELPDDATLDDVRAKLLSVTIGDDEVPPVERTGSDAHPEVAEAAEYHLERRGRFTVIVPRGASPTITAEMVNQTIDDIRREREVLALGPYRLEE